jgi:DNA-binding transcriptional MerR regulator
LETLSPNQTQALSLIAANYSKEEVARQTGVTIRTLDRWRKQPEFQRLLRDAIARTFDAAVAELVVGAQESARELKRIISDPDVPSRTKVTAIGVLFANGSKAKDWALEERLSRLEMLLEDGTTDQSEASAD